MRVLVTTVKIPFVHGGAEILADSLIKALREAGHQAEIVSIPFKSYPHERILDNMLACRVLDISEFSGQKVDRVVGLKFPAYLIPHPHKVMWLVHQHRTAYDLWGTEYCDLIHSPNGVQIREAIINADNKVFQEYKSIYTIAGNVSKRLKHFNYVDSVPIYNPPQNAHLFYCDSHTEDYFFFPSRLTKIKRQELVIAALALTKNPVKVLFAGKADQNQYLTELQKLVHKLGVAKQAIFLGEISEPDKIKYYAQSLAVIYPPFDEDYGYVSLEAMLSSKAVITCKDSGGSLEFVRNRETGLIIEPSPEKVAKAMDELWENRYVTANLGKAAKDYYYTLNITWSNIIEKLLS
ncbi:glycosyltransferase family 4 protein [Nostoc commune]|uniref:glycosyltransferase family 4 protein n=1 Tax=Nostoc commune TaxID=1178 RepID=UPI0018C75082|nr:glycosyltransferase family 4 protein [Nostoc commune]MBG1260440.1 glycosyltransferase family 4 protein [Nostoc commune BAE]